MIIGIGIDIIDLERIVPIIKDKRSFIKRVLTENELAFFFTLSDKRKVEYFAGRFACKEAFVKALGVGIGKVGFQDIEILTDESGRPIITKMPFSGKAFVSISHSDHSAVAQIILETTEGKGC